MIQLEQQCNESTIVHNKIVSFQTELCVNKHAGFLYTDLSVFCTLYNSVSSQLKCTITMASLDNLRRVKHSAENVVAIKKRRKRA